MTTPAAPRAEDAEGAGPSSPGTDSSQVRRPSRGAAWWTAIFCSDRTAADDARSRVGDHDWQYLWLLPGDSAPAASGRL